MWLQRLSIPWDAIVKLKNQESYWYSLFFESQGLRSGEWGRWGLLLYSLEREGLRLRSQEF